MSLKKGSHKVVVSSPGFATQTNDFTVKNGSASQVTIALEAQTATAIKYYLNNPAEEAILEGVSGSKGSTINTSQTKNYPLISELPFVARTWRVDYGQSIKNPADPNSIAITITYGNEEGKHLALDWITSQGYDPAAYEIIYKSFTQ